jgi:3-oxoacyl-[acyl-carrier protein] reductase
MPGSDDGHTPFGPAPNTPATGLMCGLVSGKKALVTGARKGIGRAVALVLAQQGASVGICDKVDDAATRELGVLIDSHGPAAGSVHIGDLTVMQDVARVVEEFVAEHGTIDILVHCALDRTLEDGRDGFWRMEEETWDAILGLHLKASVFLCQHAATAMRAHGRARGGAIVLFSSVMGACSAQCTPSRQI